jgi:hypothetical protein
MLGDFYSDSTEREMVRAEIVRQARERAARLKPGQRDKTGEAPSRTPRRGPKGVNDQQQLGDVDGSQDAINDGNKAISARGYTRNRPGESESKPKRGGRPMGSKNKPKSTSHRAWL